MDLIQRRIAVDMRIVRVLYLTLHHLLMFLPPLDLLSIAGVSTSIEKVTTTRRLRKQRLRLQIVIWFVIGGVPWLLRNISPGDRFHIEAHEAGPISLVKFCCRALNEESYVVKSCLLVVHLAR